MVAPLWLPGQIWAGIFILENDNQCEIRLISELQHAFPLS